MRLFFFALWIVLIATNLFGLFFVNQQIMIWIIFAELVIYATSFYFWPENKVEPITPPIQSNYIPPQLNPQGTNNVGV